MPTVKLTDSAPERMNLMGLSLSKDKPIEFSLSHAMSMIGSPNLMFAFTEEDREELLSLDDSLLEMANFELGKSLKNTKELAELLIPKKAKSKAKPKPKTQPKSSKKE